MKRRAGTLSINSSLIVSTYPKGIVLGGVLTVVGNLTLNLGGLLIYNTPNSSITTIGCVNLTGGTIVVSGDGSVGQLVTIRTILTSENACLSGQATYIYNATCGSSNLVYSESSLVAEFSYQGCGSAAPEYLVQIIAGSVAGAVLLAVIVILVVFIKVPYCRKKIAPFYGRKKHVPAAKWRPRR